MLDWDAGGDSCWMRELEACDSDEGLSDGAVDCLKRRAGLARRLTGASAEPDADVLAAGREERAKERLRRLRLLSRSAILQVDVSVLTRPYSLA